MATTSNTTDTTPDNKNLARSRSLGRKTKPAPSSGPEANVDGSDRKTTEKPLPNYLKPTISSRPDPVKFLRKKNALEDNQKLIRRRSFDRPPSSFTSPSHKYLNISQPDRPAVSREKPSALRPTSFHGSSKCGIRGSSTVTSRGSLSAKKSGLSGGGSSKSKKEGSENVSKKTAGKEIAPESCPFAPAHEDEEEITKVETDEQVSEPKEEDKDLVAQPDESRGEKETNPVDGSTEKGELINEDKIEQIEEPKEPENTHENNNEDKEEIEKKVDDEEENSETVAIEKKVDDDEENSETVAMEMKETANVEDSKEKEEEESESSKVKQGRRETKAQVEEGTEVLQGKKESPTAYNDVIASKLQENSKKGTVLALAGAFQTVIDYETAASK